MVICKRFKTYADRKTVYSLQVIFCSYPKKSWSLMTFKGVFEGASWKRFWGCLLEDILRTSPERRLEVVSWKTSWRPLKKKSISDQSKTSLRPKLRRFYGVFATYLCRLGYMQECLICRNSSVRGKSYLGMKIPTLHIFSLLCGKTSNKTSKLFMHLSTVIRDGSLHFMNIL